MSARAVYRFDTYTQVAFQQFRLSDIERRHTIMAKDTLEKRKKWYYRFYVEDASGKMVQKRIRRKLKVKVRRKSFSARHWKITKIRVCCKGR